MALFGNKEKKEKTVTCAICGRLDKTGFFRSINQKQISGHYVCDSCYGVVDIPSSKFTKMNLDDFRRYRTFRDENKKLKENFKITRQFDLGTSFVFDTNNRWMCLTKNLNSTIFEAKHIRSFAIKEDSLTLIEGSKDGLIHNESFVKDQIMALIPEIRLYHTELLRYQTKLDSAPEEKKEEIRLTKPKFRIPKPFKNFNIEIRFEHPYWEVYTTSISSPDFDEAYPDASDYLNKYKHLTDSLEKLANTIMDLAFPGAKAQKSAAATAAAPVDPVAELKRYKELLDMGILTQEEFNAKKNQLLGM